MGDAASKPREGHLGRAAVILCGALFLVVLLRNAWVCDDAYITFRTSQNLVDGYGLTWNVAERVQVFTNPLWMLVMSLVGGLFGDYYYSAVFLGIALSMAALWLICRRLATSHTGGLLVFAILIGSKAFIDFTTSGLETSLAYLLIAAFAVVWFEPTERPHRRAFWLGVLAALAAVNRPDAILLFLPALGVEAWRLRRDRRAIYAILLGFSPLLAWELFSVLYYGFPFPNTYYAKLDNGVPRARLLKWGFLYLFDAVHRDPLMPMAILVGLVAAGLSRDRQVIAFAGGALLHILYVVWIGGDFMSGRFLVAPLVVCAIVIARWKAVSNPRLALGATAVVFFVGFYNQKSPMRTSARFGQGKYSGIKGSKIHDEREGYYKYTGLLIAVEDEIMPRHKWVSEGIDARAAGKQVVDRRPIGFYSFFAGPETHVIGRFGLSDPLLARLPPLEKRRRSAGHFERALPCGYRASVAQDRNLLEDPDIAKLYDDVRLVTRGPLWSRERAAAIWRLNTGERSTHIPRRAACASTKK